MFGFGMGLGFAAMLVRVLGGLALGAAFIYGIYTLVAVSVGGGLMIIGACVVGGWLLNLLSGVLSAGANAAMDSAVDGEIKR